MANYATLKAAIAAAIRENGNNEITGNLLQQQLLAIVNSLGVGYQFVGIATPETNPGTPDQNVFYLASEPGTYSNFDGSTLVNGKIGVFMYNGSWASHYIGLNVDVKPMPGSENLAQSGGIYAEIDGVEYLIDEKQTIKLTGGGWSSYVDCIMRSGIEYKITNIGEYDILAITFRNGATSSGSIDETIEPGESKTITLSNDGTNLRAYLSGTSAIFKIELATNKFDVLSNSIISLQTEISENAFDVTQKKILTGAAWTDIAYNMNAELSYNLKKIIGTGSIIGFNAYDADDQGVAVTGFSNLVNVGDNCNIKVAADCVRIRVYFDGYVSASIKINILNFTLASVKELKNANVEQDLNIAELQKAVFQRSKLIGGGWSEWTPYDFRGGFNFNIKNVSDNQSSRIIAFGLRVLDGGSYRTVTYTGDTITSLAPGQTAVIKPTKNATEYRAYFDGGSGEIEIETQMDVLSELYKLDDATKIQTGYGEKDYIQKQVIVAKDGADGHFATIADALASITDSSFINQYEVIIYPGYYNENNLLIPPYTHVHGLFPNSVVVSSKGYENTLPVFDQAGTSSKLSNMTIESHTGYCIHYDQNLTLQILVNENLVLYKAGRGPGATIWSIIGGGTFYLGTKYIWKNCVFKCDVVADAPCHTNGNQVNGSTHLLFDSCVFVNCSPRIGSVGGCGNYVCELVNCSFEIGAAGLGNWYSPIRNIEDPTLYRFNKNEWQIIGGGNKNLSMWQTQSGKTIQLVADYPITIGGSAADIIFGYNPTKNDIKTPRLNCTLTSEYYIADEKAGYSGYSELKDVFQLWKRLGDCSVTNKTLTVTVNGVAKTYTFTENYLNTKPAQSTIIDAMQAVLTNVTIQAITQTGYSYENVNTSDMLAIKVASPDILKGEFITNDGLKATSGTPLKDIAGIACEDRPIGEFVKVWTSAFRFDADYNNGEYGLDENGNLDANAATKIGFIKGYNFYLY